MMTRVSNATNRRARADVRARVEGAPWLSLRDRCGSARLGGRARRGAAWGSLSRIEVAMVLVLLALVAAVFQGGGHEPRVAMASPEAPAAAVVSLVE